MRGLRPALSLIAATGALAALAAAPGGAAGAAAGATCRTLGGRDLARDGVVRIVRAPVSRGHTRLLGCTRPGGRVHALSPVLGVNADGFRETATLTDVAGAFALVRHEEVVGALGSVDARVVDVRSGRGYTYFAASGSEESVSPYRLGLPKVAVQNRPGAVRPHLDTHGRLTVAYTGETDDDAATPTVVIALFTASGRRTIADQGAPGVVDAASLKLSAGGVASWRRDGVVRTVRIG